MPLRQQIFSLFVCLVVFMFTMYLVRQRHLREEYSVLWLATSVIMFMLVLKYDWLKELTRFIGAGLATTTLFLSAIIFLVLLSMQFSIKISKLTNQVKDLAQDNALLKAKLAKVLSHSNTEKLKRNTPQTGVGQREMGNSEC